MDINVKDLLTSNLKSLLFFGGMVVGSVLSMSLMYWTHKVKLVEVDLNKIIRAYSVVAAKSNKAPDLINKEFKEKFNHAMEQLSPRTIVVSKGYLLSTHEAIDGTKHFIESMGLNTVDERQSN